MPCIFLRLIIKLMFQQYISIFKVKMKLDCLLTACFSQTLLNKFLSVVNLRYDGRTSLLNNQNDPLERLDFVFGKFTILTPPRSHPRAPFLRICKIPLPPSHTHSGEKPLNSTQTFPQWFFYLFFKMNENNVWND